jgi:hypothetical protein
MSDKDRNKKDGQRTDKKNQARRERENPVVQEAQPRQQAKDASNLTDTQPGPGDDTREP